MNNLLLDEQPLIVMPKLATKIGLNESIILQQIHYWLEINKKANKNLNNGYYWTFNSYQQWEEQFPFWSKRTIQRTITNLESLGIVVSDNFNKLKIDRTKWYRIDYEMLEKLDKFPCGQNGTINMTTWRQHLDKMSSPIPETNTETNTETKNLHVLSEHAFISSVESYVGYYLYTYSKYFSKPHVKVSSENLILIENTLVDIAEIVDIKTFGEEVNDYFTKLPKNNNGSIVAFLIASKRIFDVDSEFVEFK